MRYLKCMVPILFKWLQKERKLRNVTLTMMKHKLSALPPNLYDL